MIDSQTEHVITFAQAAEIPPRRRRGRKTHVSTIYRWALSGSKGIVLESLVTPSGRVTSREALARFFEALTERQAGAVGGGQHHPGPIVGGRTLAQRQRASESAGRELAKRGA
jgi:hypothetical protein